MTLAAHEDKTYRGAYIASPIDAVGVGHGPREPVRRLPPRVVARPLPDRHRADRGRRHARAPNRALDYLFDRQQKADGSFPQNSTVDGTPHWGNLQLDEVAFPIVLAWQLGRTDAALYRDHVKRAAGLHGRSTGAP